MGIYKSIGEGNGTPLLYSCLESPMDGGAWWAAVHGVAKSRARLGDFPYFSLSCIGEGNGNPLQYSCLDNPRDRGVWWAAIYGVAQSRTRLKRLSSNSSIQINMLECVHFSWKVELVMVIYGASKLLAVSSPPLLPPQPHWRVFHSQWPF